MGFVSKVVRIHDDEWVKGAWKHGFMEFIHEVNGQCKEAGIEPVFGEPTHLGKDSRGQYVEEYPRARVVFPFQKGMGEGYRIVTTDPALVPIWEQAWAAVEPRLEMRASGEPS